VGKHGEFKFDVDVDHSVSEPMVDKPSLKGAWSRQVTRFKYLSP